MPQTTRQAMSGVLEGVVVLDLTQMLAGPYCTMMLADHGADVIKIEPPHGDMSRSLGPFCSADVNQTEGGYFHSINRNKRSIVLDLKNPHDIEVFLALVRKADVVVENFRHGVMDRLGLSYEVLAKENPALVYATIRGFGDQRGGESPLIEWPAFDIVAQAMSGFMSMTGPRNEPTKAGPGIGDLVPGLMCAFGIVAGVRHAERTGIGQFVDVAMYDAMLSICERMVYRYSFGDAVSTGEGNDHPMVNPFSIFACADGWMAIGCPLDAQWQELLRVMGREDLNDTAGFRTNTERVENASTMREVITTWTAGMTKQELIDQLAGRVPCGPVNDVVDIFNDPHVAAREMLPEVELPGLNQRARIAGVPVRFSATPGGVHSAGPALGIHTAEVFEQFGLPVIPASDDA
jgi:crotonobetainyl-CoA:carnitine CoA-transferase CaiB-like acyl-CoA transferase